jgi:hypothetical protein
MFGFPIYLITVAQALTDCLQLCTFGPNIEPALVSRDQDMAGKSSINGHRACSVEPRDREHRSYNTVSLERILSLECSMLHASDTD